MKMVIQVKSFNMSILTMSDYTDESIDSRDDHSEAWNEGHAAYHSGAECPYRLDTVEYSDWVDGFNKAFR